MVSYSLVSLIVRITQFITIIISLGLSGRLVNFFSGYAIDKLNLSLATAVLLLFYFIGLAILSYWPQFINIGIVFIFEVLFFILWLASFACLAEIYGSVSCDSLFVYTSICHVGKAALAFGVINWLLFMLSLGLLIAYSIVPISKLSGFASCFTFTHSFVPGIIYWDESGPNGFKAEALKPEAEVVQLEPVENRV